MRLIVLAMWVVAMGLFVSSASAQDSKAPATSEVKCAALNRGQQQPATLDLSDEGDASGAGHFNIFDVMCSVDSCATDAEFLVTGLTNFVFRTSDVLPVESTFTSGSICDPSLSPGCEGSAAAYLQFASIGQPTLGEPIAIPDLMPAPVCQEG